MPQMADERHQVLYVLRVADKAVYPVKPAIQTGAGHWQEYEAAALLGKDNEQDECAACIGTGEKTEY